MAATVDLPKADAEIKCGQDWIRTVSIGL